MIVCLSINIQNNVFPNFIQVEKWKNMEGKKQGEMFISFFNGEKRKEKMSVFSLKLIFSNLKEMKEGK